MGFNIDLQLLEHANWPDDLVGAIGLIKMEAADAAFVPTKARKLLTRHVHPLRPGLGIPQRLRPFALSWSDLRKLGVEIQRKSEDWMSTCIGELLIEMPGYARTQRTRASRANPYCDLCWRPALRNRKYCPEHDPQHNDSAYRAARRVVYCALPEHHDNIDAGGRRINNLDARMKLQRQKRHAKENDHWESAIAGNQPLGQWLEQYRPWLYSHLPDQAKRDMDAKRLLEWLDAKDTLPRSLAQAREDLHSEILSDPDQLTGIIRRADAWFWLSEQYKRYHPHGGRRHTQSNTLKN
ncbi:hypothetical protein TspCOW1_12470 [Thiohalobacter sp. COW1]|uniref:hypothetical protein n=1 Tax=Thiohalobacter sp. COW1 TaxID=2795687 RepID=UPI0019163916|nr:hypothetical protein [Thiohalobacter sp. COW1]BCO31144.1 hypothetical protein TspCOW1_12470 [Thiohalobacter sp. COW1]